MPENKLDSLAVDEIRAAVAGLKGKALSATVKNLSVRFNISVPSVYRVTEDVRARRKQRSDKGNRRAQLLEHPGLALAAEVVATRNVDPDHAIEVAKLNGHEIPVSLGTFQRYLREHQIDKGSRKVSLKAHRRWQASEPCELFQFDISGVKERWFDLTTRRILKVTELEVSKNHPNTKPDRVPLWKFTLIDDYSRRRYFRFYPISKPTSIEVIDFLLHAFRKLGVPKTLYSDNDQVIISKRMHRAEAILHKAFEESGGFRLLQHLPGNPQATGKVERSHQLIEKFEKLIGLKFQTPSIEALNEFSEQVCEALDWKEHRATGQKPILRWRATNTAMRVPPPEVIDSAFKCEEFTRRLNEDMTISYKGQIYQLPRKRPFVDWTTRTITFVWPAGEADWFVVIGLDGVEYEITRTNAVADAAGQFKQPAENTRQRTMKVLQQRAKQRKEEFKETGAELLVPGFDAPFEINTEVRPALMPKKVQELPVERLAEIAPGSIAPSMREQFLNRFQALRCLLDEGSFDNQSESFEVDKEWLFALFDGRDEIADTEIRAALKARDAAHPTNLLIFEKRA